MITIKITNAKEIFERESNWFLARVIHHFIDVQTKVEEVIARQIENSLAERNIKAVVSVTKEERFFKSKN